MTFDHCLCGAQSGSNGVIVNQLCRSSFWLMALIYVIRYNPAKLQIVMILSPHPYCLKITVFCCRKKWFIYLTNWSFTMLTVGTILQAICTIVHMQNRKRSRSHSISDKCAGNIDHYLFMGDLNSVERYVSD